MRKKDKDFLIQLIKRNGICPVAEDPTVQLSQGSVPCINCPIYPGDLGVCYFHRAKEDAIHMLRQEKDGEAILLEVLLEVLL